jgi:hypothetical protein
MVDPTQRLPDLQSQDGSQLQLFQDLLPKYIPNARVMLFSLQSTAIEDTAQDRTLLSGESLTQFAKSLLEKVAIERGDDAVSLWILRTFCDRPKF